MKISVTIKLTISAIVFYVSVTFHDTNIMIYEQLRDT